MKLILCICIFLLALCSVCFCETPESAGKEVIIEKEWKDIHPSAIKRISLHVIKDFKSFERFLKFSSEVEGHGLKAPKLKRKVPGGKAGGNNGAFPKIDFSKKMVISAFRIGIISGNRSSDFLHIQNVIEEKDRIIVNLKWADYKGTRTASARVSVGHIIMVEKSSKPVIFKRNVINFQNGIEKVVLKDEFVAGIGTAYGGNVVNGLQLKIELKQSVYDIGDPLKIGITLNNISDKKFRVLKRATHLDLGFSWINVKGRLILFPKFSPALPQWPKDSEFEWIQPEQKIVLNNSALNYQKWGFKQANGQTGKFSLSANYRYRHEPPHEKPGSEKRFPASLWEGSLNANIVTISVKRTDSGNIIID